MGISVSGDFGGLEKYLKKSRSSSLDILGKKIVDALKKYTPKDSSKTAESWGGEDLEIYNSNINNGVNIAIILHYGHGTGTGGYVPPRPYIDDAINSVYKNAIQKVLEDYLK